MSKFYSYCPSPVGDLLLAGDGANLQIIGFPEGKARTRHEADWILDDEKFVHVKQQLAAYFAGERQEFNIALAPEGTQFQQSVWKALTTIPYGKTCSYGDIAHQIGKPKASRAVGAAKPHSYYYPLPSRHWQHRKTNGIWRGIGSERNVIGPRATGTRFSIRGLKLDVLRDDH